MTEPCNAAPPGSIPAALDRLAQAAACLATDPVRAAWHVRHAGLFRVECWGESAIANHVRSMLEMGERDAARHDLCGAREAIGAARAGLEELEERRRERAGWN